MAYRLTTILVSQAAQELNLTEQEFRSLLKPLYKNWQIVKRVKYGYYQAIRLNLEIDRGEHPQITKYFKPKDNS